MRVFFDLRFQSIVFFASLFISTVAYSQDKYTISGTISDGANGETMIGTNVFLEPIMKGTTTNDYGFYSITVPEG
ncbi:MAG: hypothetical protein ACI8VL_000749, partial [Bacteroidia bacterium]